MDNLLKLICKLFFLFLWAKAEQSVTVWITGGMLYNLLPTFPHEDSFIMVHYLCRDQSVIDHGVVLHAGEGAVLDTAAELVLRQGTLQEGAHLLDGGRQVLDKHNDTQSFKRPQSFSREVQVSTERI